MRKFLWSIPGLTLYVYITSVLIQYGYNSYFGIPADFINASVTTNIINYFGLYLIATGIAGLMAWWGWFILIAAGAAIWLLCLMDSRNHSFFVGMGKFIGTGLMLYFMYISFTFGAQIAASKAGYLVPSPRCFTGESNAQYIVTGFYNDKAILVPVDTTTKKLTGGFSVKDLSQEGCILRYSAVGPFTR